MTKTANDIANESLKNLIGSQAMMLAQVGAELTVALQKIKELETQVPKDTDPKPQKGG